MTRLHLLRCLSIALLVAGCNDAFDNLTQLAGKDSGASGRDWTAPGDLGGKTSDRLSLPDRVSDRPSDRPRPVSDLAPDVAPVPDVMQPDTRPPADLRSPDQRLPDAAPRPDLGKVLEKVVYCYGAGGALNECYPAEVRSDGTGLRNIPGTAYTAIQTVQMTASPSVTFYPTDIPRAGGPTWVHPHHDSRVWTDYIQLPGSLGRLYRFQQRHTKAAGLMVVRPAGALEVMAQTTGAWDTEIIGPLIAVSTDGKRAAVVKNKTSVALVRLDGTIWPGGTTELDVTPPGASFAEIHDESLALLGKTLYFVVEDSAGLRSLYSAPLSGSGKATRVSLPQVGGKTPMTIEPAPASNSGRTHVAYLVGTSATAEDVVVIPDGGTAVNVSRRPLDLLAPGNELMSALSPGLALSPAGTRVVWASTFATSNGTSGGKVWVGDTSGAGTPVEITSPGTFVPPGTGMLPAHGAFYFNGEDDLLFWGGMAAPVTGATFYYYYLDLFRYRVSTGALVNVTRTGSRAAAPWAEGTLNPYCAFLSPNGKYLYMAANDGTITPLYAVDLSRSTATPMTTAASIGGYRWESMEAVGSRLWFVGVRPRVTGTADTDDLFTFDMNSGDPKALKQLTSHAAGVRISFLGSSRNGKAVFYCAGLPNTRTTCYLLDPAGASAPRYAGDWFQTPPYVTADGASMVYGSGPGDWENLYHGDLVTGASKRLQTVMAVIFILNSGT